VGLQWWNLSARKKVPRIVSPQCHQKILNIRWQQVREDRISNKQVRFCFCNIPKIESFINKRMATYIGKIARFNDKKLTKKLLGAWMH
jgi:hypothetical protein